MDYQTFKIDAHFGDEVNPAAIAIEDSENGLQAATQAGIHTLHFRGDWQEIRRVIDGLSDV